MSSRLEFVGADGEQGVGVARGGADPHDVLERLLGLDLDPPGAKQGAFSLSGSLRDKNCVYEVRKQPSKYNAWSQEQRRALAAGCAGVGTRGAFRFHSDGHSPQDAAAPSVPQRIAGAPWRRS